MRGDGSSDGPVYNKLQGAVGGPGEFLLNFSSYTPPNGEFQWIAKALLVDSKNDQLRSPIVMFKEFRPEGIVLSIRDGGTPVPPDIIKNMAVMAEVSRYEAKV